MKHRNKHQNPHPKTAFERETERRRREMIRNLSGPAISSNRIPTSRLKIYIRDGVKPVRVRAKAGPIHQMVYLRKTSKGGYSNRNIWRDMMRKVPRAVAA